jgi:hypothetical protein
MHQALKSISGILTEDAAYLRKQDYSNYSKRLLDANSSVLIANCSLLIFSKAVNSYASNTGLNL